MAYAPSKSRRLSKKESKDLNLIPIMNLFIVIIPMLMTIMVSVHLAMIEITLPKASSQQVNQELEVEPPPRIILAIFEDRFELTVGEEDALIIEASVTSESGITFNYMKLDSEISKLKLKHETQSTVDIFPDPNVRFDTLLRSIDICKDNSFPNIKYLTSSKKYYKAKKRS